MSALLTRITRQVSRTFDLNKKDKMTIKVSKRNKIINKMHKNNRNIDCSFDIIMLC